MSPVTEHAVRVRRAIAVFVVALPLLVLAASSLAALRPRVKSPHGKFKEECGLCHGAESWKPARISPAFDHSRYGFRLEGAHKTGDCTTCHTSLDFAQARTQCQSCHEDPHRGEMGVDCARCHGARSFTDRAPMVRAHQLSRFPLTGSHASLACETCHQPAAQGRMQFVGARADCQGCHMKDYRAVTTPNHVTGGFPTDCQQCHTTLTWSTAKFDHERSGFPLTGAHRSAACAQCHVGGRYAGTPRDCQSCHQTEYNAATPNHPAAGFAASACASCHNTTTWSGASFDHGRTSFPLTGAHRTAACASCHVGGVYAGTSSDCFSCHRTEFTGATPNHPAAGFAPSACVSCHNTTAWAGATFDHNTTSFPLTGAHRTAACATCHVGGVYNGTATDCYSCHRTDYDGATPNHPSAGFAPSACVSCHNTTTWAGATFDHNATSFPLTGVHRTTACATCHVGGVYNGTPADCFSCHRTDYDGATPNHASAGFAPAQCATCHTTTTWTGATFNHDASWFPIYSGRHRGKWTACSDCHTNSSNYTVFTCLSCHPHSDRTNTDGHHQGRSGYSYDSAACYRCHPRGTT